MSARTLMAEREHCRPQVNKIKESYHSHWFLENRCLSLLQRDNISAFSAISAGLYYVRSLSTDKILKLRITLWYSRKQKSRISQRWLSHWRSRFWLLMYIHSNRLWSDSIHDTKRYLILITLTMKAAGKREQCQGLLEHCRAWACAMKLNMR